MQNTLGKRIKFLREEKEISQLEFSKILNINNSTLSQYEAGNRMPGDEIKKKIAEYFNVSLDYLMGASNVKNPYKDKEEQNLVPEEFVNSAEARAYVNKHQIFVSGGFDSDKLDDNEILEFANALLEQMKMVSYKYKK
ncbi:helix-turn-helix transcriptional regulator [Tissierella sp. MB52-C2]|uniref:helix-turn-helix domain-containing protein n=1 Tax=Tissierella sp. MB52-C2 TaxID=3070999 RepID=UPI00280C38A4|nr:helix-turn-helix transcriptional regulator [Tissierella sp. MB52-C2]WMM25640.1 helix-turn-helix transcriptional regulator [Tissierella sp. MB52-C2]